MKLKYVLQIMKSFVRNEPVILLLILACIVCSAIMVLFSFGFYHQVEQKKMDDEFGIYSFSAYFYNRQWPVEKKKETALNSKVRKGNLLDLLFQLEDTIDDSTYIEFELMYPEALDMEERMDMFGGSVFNIENGHVTISPVMINRSMQIGRYFTKEDIEEGRMFCIGDYWIDEGVPNNPLTMERHFKEENPWLKPYMPTNDGKYHVGGKEYECIGNTAKGVNVYPEVPITTVSDDVFVKRLIIQFERPMTRKQYEIISDTLIKAYGEEAMIDPVDIHETDAERFYNTLLLLCIFVSVLSAVVVSFFYEYIQRKRKRTLMVYRICGMTLSQMRIICFGECLFLLLFCFITGCITFHFVLLPFLDRYYEYIRLSYSIRTYIVIGVVYVLTFSLVIQYLIRHHNRK